MGRPRSVPLRPPWTTSSSPRASTTTASQVTTTSPPLDPPTHRKKDTNCSFQSIAHDVPHMCSEHGGGRAPDPAKRQDRGPAQRRGCHRAVRIHTDPPNGKTGTGRYGMAWRIFLRLTVRPSSPPIPYPGSSRPPASFTSPRGRARSWSTGKTARRGSRYAQRFVGVAGSSCELTSRDTKLLHRLPPRPATRWARRGSSPRTAMCWSCWAPRGSSSRSTTSRTAGERERDL